jgi:hypothetical protein
MTHKVNPSLFRLGINKKPLNFLYIDKILNQKISQQSWLFVLNFLKKTIIYSLKYVIIFDRTLKKEEKKLNKNKKLKKNKKNTLIKYNPLKINRFDILNITFNNTTHNCLIAIDKEFTPKNISIIITTLRININLFDKNITNNFLMKRKNVSNKKYQLKRSKFKSVRNIILNNNKKLRNHILLYNKKLKNLKKKKLFIKGYKKTKLKLKKNYKSNKFFKRKKKKS